jgi:hypothetical protein
VTDRGEPAGNNRPRGPEVAEWRIVNGDREGPRDLVARQPTDPKCSDAVLRNFVRERQMPWISLLLSSPEFARSS